MGRKKRILISCLGVFDAGGIDSALVNLLNEIHDRYDVTLYVASQHVSPNFSIPEDVKILRGSDYIHDIGVIRKWQREQSLPRKILRNIRRILRTYVFKSRVIERALNRLKVEGDYDVAIAFADYPYDEKNKKIFDFHIVENLVHADRKIAWMHNNPEKFGWTAELCEARLSGFDAIVSVSEANRELLGKICPKLRPKMRVVLNTYDIDSIMCKGAENVRCFQTDTNLKLVTVSRAVIDCKRPDRIVEVCSRLKADGVGGLEWKVVGGGDDLDALRAMARKAGVDGFLHFIGWTANPFPYMRQADALVLCSEYEAFGMVLREAQILGTPVFATDYPAAVEAIDNGLSGEICPNSTDGLYAMIKSVLENPSKLTRYREYIAKHPVDNSKALAQFKAVLER